MDNATLHMLNDAEQQIIRTIEGREFESLDEDALIDLHARVRRARTKYNKLYRRRSTAQVGAQGTRALASAAHQRTARKAEVFERALAQVSRRLARVASISARELRDERIEAARTGRSRGGTKGRGGSRPAAVSAKEPTRQKKQSDSGRGSSTTRTPISKKASATSRASTRRAEARRDSR